MQTAIMLIDTELAIDYYLIEGDYSHLNGVWINATTELELENEAVDLFYDARGNSLQKQIEFEDFALAVKQELVVFIVIKYWI